jgi:hypothetical protein
MPDITMCNGEGCPLKENCYRFTATPSEYSQSYFIEIPYDNEYERCEHHWKMSSKVYQKLDNKSKK